MIESDNTTRATTPEVDAFLAALKNPARRADAEALAALFQEITGFAPRLWGPSIVGYGHYHYRYDSGHTGKSLATGFSPRAANLVVYIMPGYTDFRAILSRLGKCKRGKSCLYINKLADIDLAVLDELIRAGLADLNRKWPVQPT
ncbi:DUF1801 domain-containing protein [Pararhodobacter sp.]|uniref:DUF1801 domain-containing protein n=1 Tax=Pararhodobacter sp. TaxID=2127056 RepID=UPI002AFF2C34|nr:DUF1801 domain-containing protein [Pararhodobacter sp.]